MNIARMIVAGAMLMASGAASAFTTVDWADLTSATTTQVQGTIAGTNPVGVTIDSNTEFYFTQTDGGLDFWTLDGIFGLNPGASTYTGVPPVVNRPTGTDAVSLIEGGTITITFDRPVYNPVIAFYSWNNNYAVFSAPFTIISQGGGYWGDGTFDVYNGNTEFFGNGEVHGVLGFAGWHEQLSFSHTYEASHGFTVGAAAAIPEPATWAMLIAGFGMVGAAARMRRRTTATTTSPIRSN